MSKRKRIAQLEECIEGLCIQFSHYDNGYLHHSWMSSLERAYQLIGWEDMHEAPTWMVCEKPECLKYAAIHYSDKETGVRHNVCRDHQPDGWPNCAY